MKFFLISIFSLLVLLINPSMAHSQNESDSLNLVDYWAQNVTELKMSMNNLSAENDIFFQENQDLIRQINILSGQIKEMNAQIKKFGSSGDLASKEIKKIRNEILRLEEKLNHSLKKKSNLEDKTEKFKNYIDQKQVENQQIESRIERIRKNIGLLDEKNDSKVHRDQQDFDKHEGQEVRLVEMLEMSETDLSDWKSRIENLNGEFLSFRQRFQVLNKENQEIYQEMLSIYENLKEFSPQQHSLTEERDVLLGQYQTQIDAFSKEVSNVAKGKKHLQNEFMQVQQDIEKFKHQVDTEKIRMLQSESLALENENRDLKKQFKKLQKDLVRVQKQRKNMENRIKSRK